MKYNIEYMLRGMAVAIHPQLTTDPCNKQGMTGSITAILPNSAQECDLTVAFDDGVIGRYQSGAVLCLYPSEIIRQGLTTNINEFLPEDRFLSHQLIELVDSGDAMAALKIALTSSALQFFCTTTCRELIELYREAGLNKALQQNPIVPEEERTRVIAYTRQAVTDPSGEGNKLQEEVIRKYCAAEKFDLVHVFFDNGASDVHFERPGWQAMKEFLQVNPGIVKMLFVTSLDRISRNVSAGVAELNNLERDFGISVRTTAQGRSMKAVLEQFKNLPPKKGWGKKPG